jgi:hypothetical protein
MPHVLILMDRSTAPAIQGTLETEHTVRILMSVRPTPTAVICMAMLYVPTPKDHTPVCATLGTLEMDLIVLT